MPCAGEAREAHDVRVVYRLLRVGKRDTLPVAEFQTEVNAQLACLSSEEVVIVFTFPNQSTGRAARASASRTDYGGACSGAIRWHLAQYADPAGWSPRGLLQVLAWQTDRGAGCPWPVDRGPRQTTHPRLGDR